MILLCAIASLWHMANLPKWLDSNLNCDMVIIEFLKAHDITVRDYKNHVVQPFEFFPEFPNTQPNLSKFVASKDSLIYAHFLKTALARWSGISLLADLGTGSAIPLISAVLNSPIDIDIVGIDVDTEALEVAKKNIELFHLEERIGLRQESMRNFLSQLNTHEQDRVGIAANPPYMPCPIDEEQFLPVNGGVDGSFYVEQILNESRNIKYLALQWGSVTNPVKVFKLISCFYRVEFVETWEVGFGKYSLSPAINSHLHSQRSKGLSSFSDDGESNPSQLIFVALLKPVSEHLNV